MIKCIWLIVFISLFFAMSSLSVPLLTPEEVDKNSGNSTDKDNKKLHTKKPIKRSQLLAHMAERMNLDGEGLRHIRKHLIDVAGHGHLLEDVLDIQQGDNIKGIFYFFRLHDYDNNQKLDGLEWLKALTHFHEKGFDDSNEVKSFEESEAVAIIDELLEKHDNSRDGMIDFLELMNTKVDSLLAELSKDEDANVSEQDLNQPGDQEQPQKQEQQEEKQEFEEQQQQQQPEEEIDQQQEQKSEQDQQQTQRQADQQDDQQQSEQDQQQP